MRGKSPGLNPQRLITLMQPSIQRSDLQLQAATILTEAATGAYLVTPVLAAMAGAEKVFGLTKATRYGSIEQVRMQTQQLAEMAGVSDRIEFITEKLPQTIAQADIINLAMKKKA